jgi:hypothetical protein
MSTIAKTLIFLITVVIGPGCAVAVDEGEDIETGTGSDPSVGEASYKPTTEFEIPCSTSSSAPILSDGKVKSTATVTCNVTQSTVTVRAYVKEVNTGNNGFKKKTCSNTTTCSETVEISYISGTYQAAYESHGQTAGGQAWSTTSSYYYWVKL